MWKKKKVVDTKLYKIMGVETDVTSDQLKKAYRKKALQLHPDKRGNSPNAQEEFMQMKYAYDVLSDPKRKEIYDTMGEDGLKMVEQFGNLDADEMSAMMLRSLLASGPKGKCIILTFFLLIFGFLLLIPIFWCLRIDKTIEWNWMYVFIPLWIVDLCIFLCIGCTFFETQENDTSPNDTNDKIDKIIRIFIKCLRLIAALLFLILQIFIGLKINHLIQWSMHSIFIPYYIFEGFILLQKIVTSKMAYKSLKEYNLNIPTNDSNPNNTNNTIEYNKKRKKLIHSIISSISSSILRILFSILLAEKLDHKINKNWWIIFIPIWILIGSQILSVIHLYYIKKINKNQLNKDKYKKTNSKTPTNDDFTNSDSNINDQDQEHNTITLCSTLCSIIGILIGMSPFFILASRLQTGHFSSFYIILPWIIISGLFMCCIGCTIICGVPDVNSNSNNTNTNDNNNNNNNNNNMSVPNTTYMATADSRV